MKLTEKQLEQIRAQIKRVKEFGNPFYTKRFANVNPEDIKTQEDFENLVPFVTKQELRDAYPLGLATVPEEEIVRIHSSSGTTGAQVVIPYTKKDVKTGLSCLPAATNLQESQTKTAFRLHRATDSGQQVSASRLVVNALALWPFQWDLVTQKNSFR